MNHVNTFAFTFKGRACYVSLRIVLVELHIGYIVIVSNDKARGYHVSDSIFRIDADWLSSV